jgi:hypothetical protein
MGNSETDGPMNMTRLLSLATTAAFTLTCAGVGCQRFSSSADATYAPEPTEVPVFAGTTQPVRDWDQSVAFVQNGDTVARSPGIRWRTKDDLPAYAAGAAEVGVFIGNVVVMPYTLYQERGAQVSTGTSLPPTHTAMPVMPPPPAVEPQPGLDEPLPAPVVVSDPTVTPGTVADVVPTTPADVLASTTQPSVPSFTITGQVVRPGTFEAAAGPKLSQVVAAAGPASQDPAKVHVTLARPNEEPASTTLADLLSGASQDVTVQADDQITVEVIP